MQIGPIEYGQEEERAFFKSLLLGSIIGLPMGILLTYFVGFLEYPHDFWPRFFSLIFLMTSIGAISMLFSTALYLSLFKKREASLSWHDAAKMIWAFVIASLMLWIYVALVMSLVVSPLFDATFWLNPLRKYWLGALVMLPFLFLFVLIFFPDQRPRKIIHRFWLITKGEAAVPRLNQRRTAIILLIAIWLTLIFLPLPTTALTNLVLIGGGLLVIAYLMRDRYRIRKRNGTIRR